MPRANYICHKECYYANTLFKVGDPLPKQVEPGKHFSIDGEHSEDDNSYPVRPGDDKRSTAQIIQDIMDDFPEVKIPPGSSRKEIFALWIEAKKKSEFVPAKTPDPDPKKNDVKNNPTGAPEKEVRFADMTPDQIADITQKGIAEKVERMYKQEFKYAGASKGDLIKRAIVVEEKYRAKKVGANAE